MTHSVTATDGAVLTVEATGSGPGVLLIYGGGVDLSDYRRLVAALSQQLTVYTWDRRGRGTGVALGAGYSAATEIEDIAAILGATGVEAVFGHSGGAFLALQAALRVPLRAIAVYDPAVAIDNLFPKSFLEPYAQAVHDGDYVTALTVMSQDVNSNLLASRLPLRVRRGITRAFLRTPIGRHLASLQPVALPEIRAIAAADGPASQYAEISASTLLAHGARSAGYYIPICDRLAAAIPNATVLRISRASHNAANIARPWFVAPFLEFYRGALGDHSAASVTVTENDRPALDSSTGTASPG